MFVCSMQFNTLGEGMPVVVYIREKKKWRKYPCTVRNNCFIQFKDAKVGVNHPPSSLDDLYVLA